MLTALPRLLSPLLLTTLVATAALPDAQPPTPVVDAFPAPAAAAPTTPIRTVPVPRVEMAAAMRTTSQRVLHHATGGSTRFSMLGVTWTGGRTGDVTVRMRVRSGGTWQPWVTPDVTPAPEPGALHGSDPLWVGDADRYEVQVTTGTRHPVSQVQAVLLNPRPTDAEQAASDHQINLTSAGALVRPPVVTRAGWGSDPKAGSTCSSSSARLEAMFVHHTAGSNSYTAAESAAVVRGIQAYHTRGQGWCDIGYHFLVDKFGTIFEGRRGGMDVPVTGAHVYGYNTNTVGVSMIGNYDTVRPTEPMLESVARVVAWKADTNYLDPTATTTYDGERIAVVSAHRDVAATACPGRYGYAAMPGIRARAAELVASTPPSLIEQTWAAGARTRLGFPYRGERLMGKVRVTEFSGGSLYATPWGFFEVPQPLARTLTRLGTTVTGWPSAPLTADGPLQVQPTAKGAAVAHSGGSFWLPSDLYAAYIDAGGATSWLGLPTSGPTADGSGRSVVTFTGGTLTRETDGTVTAQRVLSQVRLTGRGYGHGRGMSQWGAQGAAVAGRSTDDIVGFYYPGTGRGHAVGLVRVWVTADRSADLLVRPQRFLRVKDLGRRKSWLLPRRGDITAWRMRYTPRNRVVLEWSNGRRWFRHALDGRAEFTGAGEFFGGGPIELVTGSGTVSYRGALRTADRPGTDMDTINVLPMNAYLRGVVAREAPASWKPAALGAQAVAARTYAAWHRSRAWAQRRDYDLCDTTSCQVYGGVPAERPTTDAAVWATSGHIRVYGGAPILAEFSASNGGMRVGSSVRYQQYGADPYDPWSGNPVRSWQVTLPADRILRVWPRLGKLTGVRVTTRDGYGTWGGRAVVVELTGTHGNVLVSGEEMRSRFGLRSTFFTVA